MGDPIGDIIGGIFGSQAAGQQQQNAKQAMDLQTAIYGDSSAELNPYAQGGRQSLAMLMQGLQNGQFNQTVNPQTLVNDPGYQFRMQQAQQALQRGASAKGQFGSGGFAKALDQYSQGLASQEYQQAFNNQRTMNNDSFNRLYQTTGLGANAAAQYGQLGQNYANSMGQLYGAMGNAQAAGTMAWGNALTNEGSTLGGPLTNGLGMNGNTQSSGPMSMNMGSLSAPTQMLGGYAPSMGMGGGSALGAGSTAGAADAVGAGGSALGSDIGLAALA